MSRISNNVGAFPECARLGCGPEYARDTVKQAQLQPRLRATLQQARKQLHFRDDRSRWKLRKE